MQMLYEQKLAGRSAVLLSVWAESSGLRLTSFHRNTRSRQNGSKLKLPQRFLSDPRS